MSYWRLFYHLVWATKRRESLIDEDRRVVIERLMRVTCHEVGAIVHTIGMMPDHVHVAASVPPRIAISAFVQQLKGESSHMLNHGAGRDDREWFGWQPQFGVVSFGERSLADVIAYVENQRAHHDANRLWPLFEITELHHPTNGQPVASPEGAS